jgi:DNA-binding MarR family transcriptional regulator
MPLDPDLYRDLAGFRFALRRFIAAAEAISKAAGITQPQYQALLAIKTWPGGAMTIKDLAEQLLLTHHGAVQLVNRMAKAGHVARRPSTTDRRSVIVELTAAGEALVDALAERHLDEALRQEPLITGSLRRLRQRAGKASGD